MRLREGGRGGGSCPRTLKIESGVNIVIIIIRCKNRVIRQAARPTIRSKQYYDVQDCIINSTNIDKHVPTCRNVFE